MKLGWKRAWNWKTSQQENKQGVINKHESWNATKLNLIKKITNFLSKVRNAILDSQRAQKAMNFAKKSFRDNQYRQCFQNILLCRWVKAAQNNVCRYSQQTETNSLTACQWIKKSACKATR